MEVNQSISLDYNVKPALVATSRKYYFGHKPTVFLFTEVR